MQALLSRLVSRIRLDRLSADHAPVRRLAQTTDSAENDDPSYSFQGGSIGFACYWLALAIPFWVYGSNTLFFLLYTWPFFLALMPVAVVVGIALHSLLNGKLLYSTVVTIVTVVLMFGLLFLWLMG